MPPHSSKLKDRILWIDGDSTVSSGFIVSQITKGNKIDGLFVDELTQDITQYNQLVKSDQQILVKESVKALDLAWRIPKQYQKFDVTYHIANKFFKEAKRHEWRHGSQDYDVRMDRLCNELNLYEELDLVGVLRTLIYIINTLQHNNVVWGVGRGSSVSSYILYLIGVHDVDSVEYELDIKDFLRTSK